MWEDLQKDLLVQIFSDMRHEELVLKVSCVCHSWGLACWDFLFLRETGSALDFTALRFVKDERLLMNILVRVGNDYSFNDVDGEYGFSSITKMIFPKDLILCDNHLAYLAQRSQKLKMLSLISSKAITGKGFSRAIRNWKAIESILLGPVTFTHIGHIIKEIGINCKNLQVLCLDRFHCPGYLSPAIAENLRQLKVVKLQDVHFWDFDLKVLLSKCLKLVELDLINCVMLSLIENSYGYSHEFRYSVEFLKLRKFEVGNSVKWCTGSGTEQKIYGSKEIVDLLRQEGHRINKPGLEN